MKTSATLLILLSLLTHQLCSSMYAIELAKPIMSQSAPTENSCEGILLFKPRIFYFVNKLAAVTKYFKPIETLSVKNPREDDFPTASMSVLLSTTNQSFEAFNSFMLNCTKHETNDPDHNKGSEITSGLENIVLSLHSFKQVATMKFIYLPHNCNQTEAKSIVIAMKEQVTRTQLAIEKLVEMLQSVRNDEIMELITKLMEYAFNNIHVNMYGLDTFNKPIDVLEKELVVVKSEVEKICGATMDESSEEITTDKIEEGKVAKLTSTAKPIPTSSSVGLTQKNKCFSLLLPLAILLFSYILRHPIA